MEADDRAEGEPADAAGAGGAADDGPAGGTQRCEQPSAAGPEPAGAGAGGAAQPALPRRGRRLAPEPIRAADRGDGGHGQQQNDADELGRLFDAVWQPVGSSVLKKHEAFIVAALPACQPGGCRCALGVTRTTVSLPGCCGLHPALL
jgi:hypothetical protein